MSPHSDEPVVLPSSGTHYRLLIVVAVILGLAGIVLYPQLHRSWMEHKSHAAERGALQGALYEIPLKSGSTTMELGWAGDRLAVVFDSPPAEDTTLQIRGPFGEETLTWNEELGLFGPTTARMDPYRHYRVFIRIETDDTTLWSGKKWALGIHDHSHHHH